MLKFERTPYSKTLGIKLRNKNSLWSREFLIALSIGLFLHLAFPLLFKIKEIAPLNNFTLPTIKVKTEAFSGPVVLETQETFASLFTPPPSPELSHLVFKKHAPESYINFATIKKTAPQLSAYLRGENAQKLWPTFLLDDKLEGEFLAEISLRSDQKGKLFWFDWIKKPGKAEIVKKIESWIKTLTFPESAAFIDQKLEIHYLS